MKPVKVANVNFSCFLNSHESTLENVSKPTKQPIAKIPIGRPTVINSLYSPALITSIKFLIPPITGL